MDEIYDRQIRIWGNNAQKLICNANILFINCTVQLTEIIKNLLLCGLNNYTILDDKIVNENHLSSFFFLSQNCLNMKLGDAIIKSMKRYNEHSIGVCAFQDPRHCYEYKNDHKFSALVVSVLPAEFLHIFKKYELLNIPIFHTSSFGFYGIFNLYLPRNYLYIENCVESIDLRIFNPFSELKEYFDFFNLSSLTEKEITEIPFPILIYKAVEIWKENNGIQALIEKPEPAHIKHILLKEILRQSSTKIIPDNFIEACKNLYNCINNKNESELMNLILDDDYIPDDSCFYILKEALKSYFKTYNSFPLISTLPDMSSNTTIYLRLKKIYDDKKIQDEKKFQEHLKTSIATTKNALFSFDFLSNYYHNLNNLKKINYQKFPTVSRIDSLLNSDDYLDWIYFIIFNIEFNEENNLELLQENILEKFNSVNTDSAKKVLFKKHLLQTIKYCGCEIYTTFALMAGICSQEIIKVITRQGMPVQFSLIFDAMGLKSKIINFNHR